MYESEHTQFMRALFAQKPHLAEDQKKGRAIWWDKQLQSDEQKAFGDASLKQSAYVYQTKG